MSIRNLEFLLRPRSVAVIGATNRLHAVGATVLHNMIDGGFTGPIMPVNPKHAELLGMRCYPNVTALPETPDMEDSTNSPRDEGQTASPFALKSEETSEARQTITTIVTTRYDTDTGPHDTPAISSATTLTPRHDSCQSPPSRPTAPDHLPKPLPKPP